MKITNKLGLPFGLVKAVSTEKHNAENCISATTLLQGVKQIILTDRHWDELEDDVSDRIWAVWGQAVHSLLESEGENDFTEQDMTYKIGDITVTGKIDNYDMANGIIHDYKTASVTKIKFGDFSDWYIVEVWQLFQSEISPEKSREWVNRLTSDMKTRVIQTMDEVMMQYGGEIHDSSSASGSEKSE